MKPPIHEVMRQALRNAKPRSKRKAGLEREFVWINVKRLRKELREEKRHANKAN